jgi:hypothetical protein
MADLENRFGFENDPADCGHVRLRRIGIQRSPLSPRRLYLVTCRDCGTTLTTRTLRDRHVESALGPDHGPELMAG